MTAEIKEREEITEQPQRPQKSVIFGREALTISARGQKEYATQVFNYNHIREIRLDIEKNEVKILTTFDDAYYRVFSDNSEKAKENALFFYNSLMNATLRLEKKDIENLKNNKKVR